MRVAFLLCMSTTSKSPRMVLRVAHHIGQQALRNYPHRFSPKKFTQPQLFACLVLKEFFRLDYRKLEALLIDTPTLCNTIGLNRVPHFTTFQKAAKRLLICQYAKQLLAQTVTLGIDAKLVKKTPPTHRCGWHRVRIAPCEPLLRQTPRAVPKHRSNKAKPALPNHNVHTLPQSRGAV